MTVRNSAAVRVARQVPVAAMAATGASIVLIDGATKALALHLLPELEAAPAAVLQLGVLHNVDLAWGLSAGGDSVVITAVAALVLGVLSTMVCSALAVHDRTAPVMLGLVVGAGVANAMDALASPAGVVDWIALGIGRGIVLNVADVAVLVGVGLAVRAAYRLALAMRGGRWEVGGRRGD